MQSITIEKVEPVIKKFSAIIQVYADAAIARLNILVEDTTKGLSPVELTYINHLIADVHTIIKAKPLELIEYDDKFPILDTRNNKREKQFSDWILKALDYEGMRSDFFPGYFQNIGIKACVYCNAQLTVSIDSYVKLKRKVRKDVKAKFQVDHYRPKSQHPCYSIALYNLYPVCGSCNNSKSDKAIQFELYQVKAVKADLDYSFQIDHASRIKFLQSFDIDDLKFTFIEPAYPAGVETFESTFDIAGIYNTQKDLIGELILKALIYTPKYKQSLVKEFPKIFTDASLGNRLIVGNYVDKEDIHKRPMSKFVQEIAKQIGLI